MRYEFIDSMRGIAILMVILVHTSQTAFGLDGNILYISEYGQMGVQLFFVASAYTLCASFDRRGGEADSIISFFIRRFFRVAPAYYIIGILGYFVFWVLLKYLVTGEVVVPPQYMLANVFSNVFFVHGLYPPGNNNIVPGGWSIGTEMLFYLFFPAVFMLFSGILRNIYGLIFFPVIVLVLSMVIIDALDYRVENNSFIYFSLLNQASVFAVGISLYFLHKNHSGIMDVISNRQLVIAFVVITVSVINYGWLSPLKGFFSIVPFLSAMSFVALIEIFKRRDSLNTNLLRKIGEQSYSMYLLHFIFAHQLSFFLNKKYLLDLIGPKPSLFLTYVLTVCLTYYLSKLSYHYIEKYFIGIGRSLIYALSNKKIDKPLVDEV
ncbi:MAG: acyltransferase [Gammaproteobacteria bacterium]|nr:acyltransferase [Gammaproteobacteria bacterium]MCK5262448.1 acyltransferase [Gammaproteobacteria bacterium]